MKKIAYLLLCFTLPPLSVYAWNPQKKTIYLVSISWLFGIFSIFFISLGIGIFIIFLSISLSILHLIRTSYSNSNQSTKLLPFTYFHCLLILCLILTITLKQKDISINNNLQLGLAEFKKYCSSCHTVNSEALVGPGLKGIINSRIGTNDPTYNYSQALVSNNSKWSKNNFISFLLNPDNFAPGTKMPNPKTSIETAEKIFIFLQEQQELAYKND